MEVDLRFFSFWISKLLSQQGWRDKQRGFMVWQHISCLGSDYPGNCMMDCGVQHFALLGSPAENSLRTIRIGKTRWRRPVEKILLSLFPGQIIPMSLVESSDSGVFRVVAW